MMNTDKAYILGLIIGGGIWGNAEKRCQLAQGIGIGNCPMVPYSGGRIGKPGCTGGRGGAKSSGYRQLRKRLPKYSGFRVFAHFANLLSKNLKPPTIAKNESWWFWYNETQIYI